jgi:hypothetical protein
MMKFTGKHDGVALAERVRKALGRKRGLAQKRMMGGVCFLLRDHMLCGTAKPGFMFRVAKGREGFVWVDPADCSAAQLGRWLARAESYVKTLPAKPRRAK